MHYFRNFLFSLCLSLSSLGLSSLVLAEEQPSNININTADAAAISTVLIGVGPEKAKAIIAYRNQYGPFQSVEELVAVKGIGESLLAKNRSSIVLE